MRKNMIHFNSIFRKTLYEVCGKGEPKAYAYYEKHRDFVLIVEADGVHFALEYYQLQCAIKHFEHLCRAHKEIELFEVVHKHSGDEVTVLSWEQFFKCRHEFYQHEGKRYKTPEEPMSMLYVGAVFLKYLYKHIRGSLFPEGFPRNKLSRTIEILHQTMWEQDYHLSKNTTVKEFFRDIIEPIYPDMTLHDQNTVWRFLRPEDTL